MLKIINFLLILLVGASSAYAEEVKLTCSIEVEESSSEDTVKRESVVTTVQVRSTDFSKSIDIRTHKVLVYVGSIVEPRSGRSFSFVDRSDPSRWDMTLDITQVFKGKSAGYTQHTQIAIDRNSGVISYEDNFRDSSGYLKSTGSGNCIKANPNALKF